MGVSISVLSILIIDKHDSMILDVSDSEIWEILPKGTRSIIVQPVRQAPKGDADQEEKNEGFVLLASSMSYAYSNKDTAWIGAVANKFRGISIFAEQ